MTQSGSWYYIEDHTHLIGSPTWKIATQKGEFLIVGLLDEHQNRIPKGNIIRIEQFKNRQIFYGPEGSERLFAQAAQDLLVHIPHTTRVVEVIEFE